MRYSGWRLPCRLLLLPLRSQPRTRTSFAHCAAFRALYLDGVWQGKASVTAQMNRGLDDQFPDFVFIGATQGKRQFLSGMIDEMSLYNRALSTEEIAKMAHACGQN